jgi:hypothetical protein
VLGGLKGGTKGYQWGYSGGSRGTREYTDTPTLTLEAHACARARTHTHIGVRKRMRACLHTHTYTHTDTLRRMQPHKHGHASTCVCVRAWVCVYAGHECVCVRVCECRRVSQSVRVRVRAGPGAPARACAGVRQRPCGCVGFMRVVFVRAFVRVRRFRMRSGARVCACVRSCACASVLCRSIRKHLRACVMRLCACVRARACACVARLCARMPRRLRWRCGGTAGIGGINSSAGGAGRPRVRGCGSATGFRCRAPSLAAGVTFTSRTRKAQWAARGYHTTVIDALSGAIYVLGGLGTGTGTRLRDVWVSTDGGAPAD